MNPQIHAALVLHDFFSENLKLNYTVIGGVALQFWGDPRFTRDVDITIEDRLELAELVSAITEAFGSRVPDPHQFARDTRMLLLNVDDVPVDVAIALRGYEVSLFKRSRAYEVEPGRRLNICSAEDLVIHKTLAGRPQDLADIQSIIYRQGEKLEVKYIRSWLKQFSTALTDASILDRFEAARAAR
jgi:hypothetical protein